MLGPYTILVVTLSVFAIYGGIILAARKAFKNGTLQRSTLDLINAGAGLVIMAVIAFQVFASRTTDNIAAGQLARVQQESAEIQKEIDKLAADVNAIKALPIDAVSMETLAKLQERIKLLKARNAAR
jgi:uncharacterized protein YlxW (UPF0749 family)